jgi:hypothetical protein
MILKMKGYPTVEIADFAEASKVFCERREESGLGFRDFVDGFVYEGKKKVARISYNGRVWPPGPYKEGQVPLWDNRRGSDTREKEGS